MRLLLVMAVATATEAQPAASPTPSPTLTCPDDATECELDIVGELVYSRRDRLAKWDNLRISTVVSGKRTLVHASINIPHRTRLRLKPGTRYRFQIAAHSPFGARDLWIINARPR